MSAPSITITRLDLQRLERVLASLGEVPASPPGFQLTSGKIGSSNRLTASSAI